MKRITKLPRQIVVLSLACGSLFSGCGGGTTGTSSTDTLRMTGSVEDPDGARVPASNVVVVAAGKGPVASTTTDQQGQFEVQLSGGIEKFSIEVDQASSDSVQRDTSGGAAMSTRIVRSSNTKASIEFFEAQIEREKLCKAVRFDGTVLRVANLEAAALCNVSAKIKSDVIAPSDFQGGIVATCQGTPVILSMGTVENGVAQAGLAGLTSECEDIQFVIFVQYDPFQRVTFPIIVG